MSSRDRLVLRAFSLWSVFVWGVLIRNMLKDHTHGAGFRVVHITLAVISISFAVATWLIASRSANVEHDLTSPAADDPGHVLERQ